MSYQTEGQRAERLGRYELLGLLATGGMAEIHLARLAGEAGFEKIVVVKRLLPELVASRAYVDMFLGEAKLVAKLSHPNVCEVHELGREGAEYFLVMPFLDGVPATELIARPREPDRIAQLRVAAGVIVQACAGLHHAHELRGDAAPGAALGTAHGAAHGTAPGQRGELVGLVHRDVSPSNLFVTAAGVIKVLDFGIAKLAGTAETEAGTIKGKAQYMAPEQLLGDPVDRRADVFGLGIVLYELATHQRLFKRASDYLAARAILEEPIPRADAADPAIPAPLADAIARALERSPAARFPDAPSFAAAIEAALAPAGGVATPSQIAAALAAQHADELTAQRTRQARIVDRARGTAGSAPAVARDAHRQTGRDAARDAARDATRDAARDAARDDEDVPTSVGAAAVAATDVPATGVATRIAKQRPRRSPWRVRAMLGGATLVLGGGAVVAAMVARGGAEQQPAPEIANVRSPDPNVRSPDPNVRSPDSNVRSPDPNVRSPDPNVRSPDPNVRSPDPNVRSPDSNVRSPDPSPAPSTPAPVSMPAPSGSHANAAVRRGSGWFSIDSTPFAQIFVDDHLVGVTPLVHKSLPAGRHRVRAVLKDGRARDLDVVVGAGKIAPPITLAW
ncbi:MAG TPA: protein kinase [Kofleriaceae bacterium]